MKKNQVTITINKEDVNLILSILRCKRDDALLKGDEYLFDNHPLFARNCYKDAETCIYIIEQLEQVTF